MHQFIKTKYIANNRINIANTYFFRGTNNIQLFWEVLEDGKPVEKGTVKELNIQPRANVDISLPIKTIPKNGREYFLNVYYRLKTAEPLLENGFELASEQLAYAGTRLQYNRPM
ncbi:DUF4981 domain-containing protein [Niabella sp. W65]|nr:DUF4981 domain-containing protein [Niabella sp. W65]MCH7364327.1 DUF4981 domain-containing protein [Niabella sp. W65]ULT40196.1 DUF4981 domain-containing protein [Niabella sp. I65]